MNISNIFSKSVLVFAAAAVIFSGTYVEAGTYTLNFTNISANNVTDAAAGESQLSVKVTNDTSIETVGAFADGAVVRFFFYNNVGSAMSITDVYFDDGTLLALATIHESSGVSFSQGASPGNLPSKNNVSPPFQATAGFTADSDSPKIPANGVDSASEWLAVDFTLKGGFDFDDVETALNLAGAEGGLRIGIHVQAFEDGGSEAFVTNPPGGGGVDLIPEPSSLVLAGVGLLGLFGHGRKREKNLVTVA